MQEIDLTYVESCVAEIGTTEDKVLPILQALQAHYGYLPKPALQHVCKIQNQIASAFSQLPDI